MTKSEIIQEISRVLVKYESPQYAAEFITNLFAEYVNKPGVESMTRSDFRDLLYQFREEYDC